MESNHDIIMSESDANLQRAVAFEICRHCMQCSEFEGVYCVTNDKELTTVTQLINEKRNDNFLVWLDVSDKQGEICKLYEYLTAASGCSPESIEQMKQMLEMNK